MLPEAGSAAPFARISVAVVPMVATFKVGMCSMRAVDSNDHLPFHRREFGLRFIAGSIKLLAVLRS